MKCAIMKRLIKMSKPEPYFCGGYVQLSNNRKGIVFLPLKDGKVIEDGSEEILTFKVGKHNDFPVGWIVEIQHKQGDSYGGWKYLHEHDDEVLTAKYRVNSVANAKWIDLENLRKRKKNISATIENMTIKELKEWSKNSPTNRRALKFYLFEVM